MASQATTTASANREAMLEQLRRSPFLEPTNQPNDPTWHGRAVSQPLAPPVVTWQSNQKPRGDKHGAEARVWLTATEYKDTPSVLAAKVRVLARFLRLSRHTLAYTGAGLSVAAGIAQAATGSTKFGKRVTVQADPTLAHCALARLNLNDLLHAWVQQNHDGLPQKAGYRQEEINEIHGSWYDPSNPVVKYSGTLRDDLCNDMYTQSKTTDLCLVLGTSLSGLNADRCAAKTAKRSLDRRALGAVIISPQRTPYDGEASLRIFGTADEVMMAVMTELGLPMPAVPQRAVFTKETRVRVPYDRDGVKSDTVATWWDLSPGQQIRVSKHNNIRGAQQPAYKNITHKCIGRVLRRNEDTCCFDLSFEQGSVRMKLGLWWIEAAQRGKLDRLPVVNVRAKEEPINAPPQAEKKAKKKKKKKPKKEEKKEEQPQPQPEAFNHFTDMLGLPVSMAQLPPVLRVVQTHTVVPVEGNNTHNWAMHVECPVDYPLKPSDFVKSVTYQLHPSFTPAVVTVTSAADGFRLARRGWGTFVVKVSIIFRPGWGLGSEVPLECNHELSFDADACESYVAVPPMKMNPGVVAHILGGMRLKPVETRVRTLDGREYIEKPQR